MKKIDFDIMKKLIHLRGTLAEVSQISWSFSVLNKQHPTDLLTDDEAKELVGYYEKLIDELKELLDK